jgi:5-methyltetrahydropteroyltriglutamate--homocysteine methyltransferase
MALSTTTIGSYPKPEYVPVPNWFEIRDLRDDAPTTGYDRWLAARSHDHEALLDRGTREIVGE